MIFRQLFDQTSGTYSYLLASRRGGEALIIDPVLEKVDRYLQLVRELDLKLVKAVDTHMHADHITGLGALIVKYGNRYDTASMFVPILVLMLLGILLTSLVRRAEEHFAPWRIADDD